MLFSCRVSSEIGLNRTETVCDELTIISPEGLACLALATQLARDVASVDVGYWHASVSSRSQKRSSLGALRLYNGDGTEGGGTEGATLAGFSARYVWVKSAEPSLRDRSILML